MAYSNDKWPHITPTRERVEHYIRWSIPFTPELLSTEAGIELKPARGYVSFLEYLGVLRRDGSVWVPGERAQAWLDRRPKTRPGGRAKCYQKAKRRRDARELRKWKRIMQMRGGSIPYRAACVSLGICEPTLRAHLGDRELPRDRETNELLIPLPLVEELRETLWKMRR
jgi:hypothetical protein